MRILWTFVLLFSLVLAYGQINQIQQNSTSASIIDRFDIKYGSNETFHAAIGSWDRKIVMKNADQWYNHFEDLKLSPIDLNQLKYLYRDNNLYYSNASATSTFVPAVYPFPQFEQSKKSILKYFYRTPANFAEIDKEGFYARINPIINFKAGSDIANNKFVFQNTRGIEIHGSIDNKVFFYTNIHENQASFLEFVDRRVAKDTIIPGQGFYKTYNSQLFGDNVGYDYLNAQGYFGAHLTPNIKFTFGHGKNFIGNGHRSLILSDYGQNYLHLKLNSKLWRFHYQNLFMEMASTSAKANLGDSELPKKYAAIHYLSYKHKHWLEVGIFESVIYGRSDNFAFGYFNPIILYRSVEQQEDSADNILLGLNAKINLLHSIQFYGQILLDEFHLDELIVNPNGWWGNKFGLQAGVKYIDAFGLEHLYLQAEWNRVRPYTYAHVFDLGYSHYNQPLAHPLGANFDEFILKGSYDITKRIKILGSFILANYGDDLVDPIDGPSNYGGNILIPLSENGVEMGYGNEVGQGVSNQIINSRISFQYMIAHNVFVDLDYHYRNQNSTDDTQDLNSSLIQLGFRMNAWDYEIDY